MEKFTLEIDIDKYLSEEEKKQYAIEVFKERLSSELFKSQKGSVQSDSEIQRIVGNITGQIVMNEVQKYIPEYEEIIKAKTIEALSKDNYNYYVFKKKDVWDGEESLAITYIKEVLVKNKQVFQDKIEKALLEYDVTEDIRTEVVKHFYDLANTMDRLAELMLNKNKNKSSF